MLQLRHLLLSLGSIICPISCSSTSPAPQKKQPQQDSLVGRIAAVYPDAGYMLIQKYRTIKIDEDTIFYSRNQQGKIHSLVLSEQKLGQFYVADIQSKNFSINDPIFQRTIEDPLQGDANQSDVEVPKTSP
jgi:hypothetical protein